MLAWIEVYDPTYTVRLGDGPIFVKSAAFSRALDETGDGNAELIGIDPRVLTLLEPRRVCEIWVHETGFAARRIGAFVIENESKVDSQSSSISIGGRSVMVSLANKITLPGLTYVNQTVESVITNLAALAGWTAMFDGSLSSEYISVPFNGDSVLRALQVIAETKGVHLRAGVSANEIEVGVFGTTADAWVEYVEGDGGEIHTMSDDLMLMERISVVTESGNIFNWALGFAGGDGDAAIDLGLSTRNFVDSIELYGRTHYFIADAGSIAFYGQIERRVDAKRIVPVDTTDSAMQWAADAAADAIKAKLDRYAFPQEVLSLTVRNVRQTIRPGDKLRIRYVGMTNKNGLPYKYREIDADYWVMKADERVGLNGVALNLEVSNIDRYRQDAAGVVVGMMDAIQVQKVDVQPYPTSFPWGPFQQPIDTSTAVEFRFPIFDNVLRLNSAKAYIIRDSWTAVNGVASSGGSHRHLVATRADTLSYSDPANTTSWRAYYLAQNASGGGYAYGIYLPEIPVTGPIGDLYTFSASDAHTHTITFGSVTRDNQLPEDLAINVNGVAVAEGVFASGSTATEWEIDITDAVLGKSGGFRGWHTMLINCGAGRGDLSVVIWVDVDISKVRL
jgi:hypothetical protein